MDLAGVVAAVGKDVTRFEPSDEVLGIGKGAFAEYARARAQARAKPANLTFEQAAAVSISGLTAPQGLRDQARVHPGQKALIVGASGGVGPTRCSWPRQPASLPPASVSPSPR
jgi:NADPH:quinone reductase-like Zn-dependent oxidoreductase